MPDSKQTNEPLALYSAQIDTSTWTVLRLDGRGFSRRTSGYRRPFDPDFHEAMRLVAETLLAETPAVGAHTASDEVSLIFAPRTDWFGGRLEKWLSTAASVAGAAFARYLTEVDGIASCDARAFAADHLGEVGDYLGERFDNSRRNCRNAYAYFGLREQGLSAREATREAELLTSQPGDIMPPETPSWEQYGALIAYVTVAHTGFNPLTSEHVATTRRRLQWLEIDSGDVLDEFLSLLAESEE